MKVKMSSHTSNLVRDKLIRDAMEAMRSENPWSVERFLKEVSEPELNQALLETVTLGK